MQVMTGIIIVWGIGFGTYTIFKVLGVKKYKVEYFDLTDRVIKNKRQKNHINERIKGIFGK